MIDRRSRFVSVNSLVISSPSPLCGYNGQTEITINSNMAHKRFNTENKTTCSSNTTNGSQDTQCVFELTQVSSNSLYRGPTWVVADVKRRFLYYMYEFDSLPLTFSELAQMLQTPFTDSSQTHHPREGRECYETQNICVFKNWCEKRKKKKCSTMEVFFAHLLIWEMHLWTGRCCSSLQWQEWVV